VFYVWFDAPIGYISITAHKLAEWEQWWKVQPGGPDVQLYNFIGKDNVPFHTMIFPASLIAADDSYRLLNSIRCAPPLPPSIPSRSGRRPCVLHAA
jgi:methionyl-tRNA synthetase